MPADNPQLPPASAEFPANSGGAPGDSAPSGVKRWSLSRIILLPLLAVCLALFAVDVLHGRLPQWRAYKLILGEMKERQPPDEELPGSDRPNIGREEKPQLTADDVHKLLGREPDGKTKASGARVGAEGFVEVYNFQGVVKNYLLKATYQKNGAAEGSVLVGIEKQ